jgi:hypothetical protein
MAEVALFATGASGEGWVCIFTSVLLATNKQTELLLNAAASFVGIIRQFGGSHTQKADL